jgi:uncharacterized protein (TIGR02453 family)
MRTGFPGFPTEAMTYFRGLARNNRREWFQERKDVFETSVKAPMIQMVNGLNTEMVKFAPDYVTDPQQAIYRIYRDTRFSKDKTPYKTHIAATFSRRGLEKHAGAGFYFSVSPKEIEVAGGLYMPGPEQLLAVRTHITEHHLEFRRIIRAKKLRELVGELWGEQLSRAPKGFSPHHPAAGLIRYKQWLVYTILDADLATTPYLFPEVLKRFRAMEPFVEFLNAPLKAKRKRREMDYFV